MSNFLKYFFLWQKLDFAEKITFFYQFSTIQFNRSLFFQPQANTITVLFFLHCITKYSYVAMNQDNIARTMGIWNKSNTHPLFVESDNR